MRMAGCPSVPRAVRVSGYQLGCRKPGVMNGTKCRGLVPDQRRRVAVLEGDGFQVAAMRGVGARLAVARAQKSPCLLEDVVEVPA